MRLRQRAQGWAWEKTAAWRPLRVERWHGDLDNACSAGDGRPAVSELDTDVEPHPRAMAAVIADTTSPAGSATSGIGSSWQGRSSGTSLARNRSRRNVRASDPRPSPGL